jgi:hypothetical protein
MFPKGQEQMVIIIIKLPDQSIASTPSEEQIVMWYNRRIANS